MTETLSDLITQRLATVGKMGLSHLQENSAKFVYLEWYQRALALEQRVEGLEGVAKEAERIATEAHLAADHYAYDLMRTVLRPLVGNMEMSVEQALAGEDK